MAYNEANNIIPKTILKSKEEIMQQTSVASEHSYTNQDDFQEHIAADPVVEFMSREQLEKTIEQSKKKKLAASKNMDFLTAAEHRDEMMALKRIFEKRFEGS